MDQEGNANGNKNANDVHGISSHHRIFIEEDFRKENIDGQASVAAHERSNEHDLVAVPFIFKTSGCHNGRHGTSETNEHRDKGTAR